MDYYNIAKRNEAAAKTLLYSQEPAPILSVYHSCATLECYLKSKLIQIDPDSVYEKSRDSIGMYRVFTMSFTSKVDLREAVKDCRKYFNESRYPYGDINIYTIEFAEMFLKYVDDIKSYVNNECASSIDDLNNKYKK